MFSNRGFWLNSIVVFLLFLPQNQIGSVIQFLLTLAILVFSSNLVKKRSDKRLHIIKLSLIILFAIGLLYASITQIELYSQSIIKILYILVIIVFFPLVKNFEINKYVIIGSLIFILVTQLSYMLNINFIINLIDNYYTSEDYFSSYELLALEGSNNSFLNFRFGGIFRNPNQSGRILTLLFAIFVVNKKTFSSGDYAVIIVFIFSILLTGSRTALLIFSVLFLSHFIILSKTRKIYYYFIPFVLLLIGLTFIDPDSRIFDFSELSGSGKDASANAKLDFLKAYFDLKLKTGSLDLLFGTYTIDEARYYFPGSRLDRFDSEIGYLIHGVGIISLLSILLFYTKIFVISDRRTKFIMILFLWTITSTVLTNFRFAFLFIIIVSMNYYPREMSKINLNRL